MWHDNALVITSQRLLQPAKAACVLASAAFCSEKQTLLAKQELKGSRDVCRLSEVVIGPRLCAPHSKQHFLLLIHHLLGWHLACKQCQSCRSMAQA